MFINALNGRIHADRWIAFHGPAQKKQSGHTFAGRLLKKGRFRDMKIAHTPLGGLSVRFFLEVVN
jgi:hypothetical protein